MDLRDYAERLREAGELQEVNEEVHWNLEAAAIESMCARLTGPALMFNRIKGYPEGHRLMAGHYRGIRGQAWRRAAICLDMDPDIDWLGFRDECLRRISSPIPPIEVASGPCKENVVLGEGVNLLAFPFPYIHDGDGGRYGTLQVWVSKDPDIPWTNWGLYRFQVHTRNKLGGLLLPAKHLGDTYYLKYEPRGEPMPICIAIGGDPAITLAGCMPVPRGQNESVVAGALRQEPLQLVRAETNELLVPADAEIVIEGELRPNERMDEGPFGEYIGFMHGPRVPRPVLRVTCITYRNNPVIPFLVEGDPAAGSCISAWYLMSIAHTLRLRGMGINYCVDAWTGEWPNTLGTANHFKLLPTNAMPEALPSQFLTWAGYGYASMAVLFDPDLKPFDAEDLIEHFFVKTHPTNFRSTDPDLAKHPLNVFQTPEEKARGIAAGMTVNTQWPAHWYPDRIPQRPTFENSYPAEVQGWVADNWEKLGLSPRDRRSSRPETSRG